MANMMTEDLMSEILLRLPAKSLIRFRCVCKAWYYLIKSPNFIDMHLKHSTTKTDLILQHYNLNPSGDTDTLSICAYESGNLIISCCLSPYNKISDPCNGLVCLTYYDILMLFNPSTKEYAKLPSSPFPCPEGWDRYVQGFGIGFVSDPIDYKVIKLVTFLENDDENEDVDEDKPANKVEIYNLSTNSWREIKCDCPNVTDYDEHGKLLNGALHWITEEEGIKDTILSFDLSTEVFREIEFPKDVIEKKRVIKSLTVLNNSLALFAYTHMHDNTEEFIDIWVMRQYGDADSWTKQISVGPFSGIWNPLMLWKNEILLENSESQLLSCALSTGEIKEFGKVDAKRGIRVMAYQESLISLDRVKLFQ